MQSLKQIKHNARYIIIFALFLCGVASADPRVRPSEWAQPVINTDLGNFYQVDSGVYRSQQPDEEHLTDLERIGIRSLLNLREYHNDGSLDRDNHFVHYRVPMNAGEINDEVVGRALLDIYRADKPILVHCWHGSDRTGVIIAMYRMVYQNWPREQAIDEFLNGGFGYHKNVYPEIEQYLQTVDIDKFKKQLPSTAIK